MIFLLSISIAYILGSIPFSFLAGKILRGIDIREHGSGNAGATNTLRVLGTVPGVVVLLLDMAKGIVAVLIAKALINECNALYYELQIVGCGVMAIIGHILPVFLKFKGGKGVATTAGVFMSLSTAPILLALLVFVLTVAISKYVSLGSILAAITAFSIELYRNIQGEFNHLPTLILLGIMVIFIIYRHKSNIKRLLNGNENKINFTKKGKTT